MRTLGKFVRSLALPAVAGSLLVPGRAHAGLTTASGTGNEVGAIAWVCLAVFVLGTLGLAFWNSKRNVEE